MTRLLLARTNPDDPIVAGITAGLSVGCIVMFYLIAALFAPGVE